MRKQMIAALFLAACIIFCVVNSSIAQEPLSKPIIDVPTNWVLEEETPYPNASAVHDPEGAGFLQYFNPVTLSVVLIYYESALEASYSYNDLREEALGLYESDPIYSIEDFGIMDVAGAPAGYVKAHDGEYDFYYLEVVFVKDNYYFTIMCHYPSQSQDEVDVNSLINSINVVADGGADGQGFPIEYIIFIVIGVVVAVVVVVVVMYILLEQGKKSVEPAQLRITAEPSNIAADGETKSVITLQLLDKNGNPIAALADTTVHITASKGKLENSAVTIPKGKHTGMAAIVSSKESGPVELSAKAENLESNVTAVVFAARKRYCMHCGAIMPLRARKCKNCGKAPSSGVDTKVCHNCKSVMPVIARFCSECGTSLVGVDKVCPNCKSVIRSGKRFCSECGTSLAEVGVVCRNCGSAIPSGARFCNNCGADQKAQGQT